VHLPLKPTAVATGGEITKKVRKEMLALIQTWGPPCPAVASSNEPNPIASGGAAAGHAGEQEWQSWPGASDMSPAMRKLGHSELNTILKVGGFLKLCMQHSSYFMGLPMLQGLPAPAGCAKGKPVEDLTAVVDERLLWSCDV